MFYSFKMHIFNWSVYIINYIYKYIDVYYSRIENITFSERNDLPINKPNKETKDKYLTVLLMGKKSFKRYYPDGIDITNFVNKFIHGTIKIDIDITFQDLLLFTNIPSIHNYIENDENDLIIEFLEDETFEVVQKKINTTIEKCQITNKFKCT